MSKAAGILLWLVTQAMGFLLTGAGHGWFGGLLFSLPLALLYPVTFARAFGGRPGSRDIDIVLSLSALILDVLLVGNILSDEYFQRIWSFDPAFVSIWIALWAGWQPFIVVSLLRKRPLPIPPGERAIDLL